MPIATGLSVLQSQFLSALSFKQGAQVQMTATLFASAVATVAPMGLLPGVPPIPLVPAGVSAGMSMIQQALSLQQSAAQATVSKMIANGVSLIAPLAPPAGLSTLAQQIESALTLDQGARENVVANLIATAVIMYYTSGGVL